MKIRDYGNGIRKYRVKNVTEKSAAMQTFPFQLENGQSFEYVEKYLQDKYNLTLQ